MLKLAVALMFIFSCGSLMHKKKDIIRAIRVSQNFPFIDSTGKLLGYDTTQNVNIYYYGDQVLYRDFYKWDTYVDGIRVKAEIRESFFVFTKGKTFGYLYDTTKKAFEIKISVDSMLQKQWYNYTNYSSASLTQLSEQYNADSGILCKVFTIKGKQDTTMTGSTFLWYTNRLPWVDYALIKEVDTVKNMKLFKTRDITNSRYLKEYNITLDTIEQTFDMREITVTNPEEILYYFDREKKYNTKD